MSCCWPSGDHFFKTLVSVATQLTSLKVDNVMLLDPQGRGGVGKDMGWETDVWSGGREDPG
jgi:hypothetical protein